MSSTRLPVLVQRSHDVGADPGDQRFPNRTQAATTVVVLIPPRERKRVSFRASPDTSYSPNSRRTASWGLRPRLSLSSELRFGVNPGATLVPLRRRLRRLPIA